MIYRNRKLLDLMAGESRLSIKHDLLIPCQMCLRWLPTCGAHSNRSTHGKGAGQKAHDCFIAALCGECHHQIDAGRIARHAAEESWHRAHGSTFVALRDAGMIEVPTLASGEWALPGTVDSAEWLRLWTSGEAGLAV